MTANWPVVNLRTVLLQPATYGIVKAGQFQPSGVPMVRGGDIKRGRISEDLPHVSDKKSEEYSRTHLKSGDVLVALVGYPGEAAVVPDWLAGGNVSRAVGLLRPRRNEIDAEFLAYYLNSPTGRREFLKPGAGSAQIVVNLRDLNQLTIPLPPLPEQRTIAAALSDVDALIFNLDSLIAKKRDIKTASMQRLLTGEQRLPGFSGEWYMKRLGDIGSIESAGVDKKIVASQRRVRLVNYMDVYNRNFIQSDLLDHWVTAAPDKARRCAVQKGDVFFTPSSEIRGDIARSAVAVHDIPDAVFSYHVVRLRIEEDWDLHFRTYAFKAKAFYDQARRLCAGSGTRYTITKPKFASMEVRVPPVDEQRAIGKALSDMDAEIEALEARREKTHALKRGMTQELLTGHTRLV